jgi:hypothetical protein
MVKYRLQARNIVQATTGAASTATIELPIGQRYHSLHLVIKDVTAVAVDTVMALISQIRVKVNGRVQRTVSGDELEDLNALNGAGYGARDNGDLVVAAIYFAEPWRKDARDQDALAWPTRWQGGAFESFQVEIDFTAANNAVNVQAFAIVDNFVPASSPQICKWLRQTFASSGTSLEITTIDRRDFLTQITTWKDASARTQSRATLRVNGQILHELTQDANLGLLTQYAMSPAGASRGGGTAVGYDLVLDHDDLLGSAANMNGASDISLTIDATGGAMTGTIIAVIQRIGPPE